VQSSRRLEREAGRYVEVMWLLGRLAPDHKTIADFRKDNGLALRKVCARFVELCREMGLLATASVAIDRSKFSGNHLLAMSISPFDPTRACARSACRMVLRKGPNQVEELFKHRRGVASSRRQPEKRFRSGALYGPIDYPIHAHALHRRRHHSDAEPSRD
jgi:hypothetical protein